MTAVKVVALVLFLVMTGSIAWAFLTGDFRAEGAILTDLPWGVVSLVDLYTGFTLFSLWIIYRERSMTAKILWVAAMMTLGFAAGSLYVLVTSWRSKGDWRHFWLGARASHV
jgi:hypothetical protein